MGFFKSYFLTPRLFIYLWIIVFFFILSYFFEVLITISKISFYTLLILLAADTIILFKKKRGIFARRELPDRFSNGDNNEVKIYVENFFQFNADVKIIDEIPFRFQKRDFQYDLKLSTGENKIFSYSLRPVERGEYEFGNINIFVSSPLKIVKRKFIFPGNKKVAVYPSYVQMRKYELLAISNRLSEAGIKRIRRIGHSTEFEQIKEYVKGDDYRTINWKATARKNELMVNNYEDEKSQQVYNVIDMGRVMKMPFNGMSLLDYAVNSCLVVSNTAIRRKDKAGVITFSNKINSMLPAENRSTQMLKILDLLYKQRTDFLESDYEKLCISVLSKVTHRSLIIIYTNFETVDSLKRQINYLKRLSINHLVLVIFFENTELKSLIEMEAENTEKIYMKTIAEKFSFEKRLIIKELNRYKIHSILTPPEKLSVNTINKYLEFKARGLI